MPDRRQPAIGGTGPTSHIFISSRLRLHYVDWGNADAPMMIMVHGGLDHCRSWDWAAQSFRHTHHVIAPDLRGHGDSAWSADGRYSIDAHVADLAQLIHQRARGPVILIGHSLGGAVVTRYAGIYPEMVSKLVVLEGLGHTSDEIAKREGTPIAERLRTWQDVRRRLSGRLPRRYETLEQAFQRMQQENPNLSPEQARHLTEHGVSQNEDGSFSWKFDNYCRELIPIDINEAQLHELWRSITAPVLLLYGEDSWFSSPEHDGRMRHFRNARLIEYESAGHWLHHDRFDAFVRDVADFLAE